MIALFSAHACLPSLHRVTHPARAALLLSGGVCNVEFLSGGRSAKIPRTPHNSPARCPPCQRVPAHRTPSLATRCHDRPLANPALMQGRGAKKKAALGRLLTRDDRRRAGGTLGEQGRGRERRGACCARYKQHLAEHFCFAFF